MTDDELKAIKARAEAATPGPWATVLGRYVLSRADAFKGQPDWPLMPKTAEDATFIAHARMDMPALVAEVERLRDALNVAWSRGYECAENRSFDHAQNQHEHDERIITDVGHILRTYRPGGVPQ